MNEKRRLELDALEGNWECYLEIEKLENGDFYINMIGQNKNKEIHHVSAQIPNPINGGGNLEDYKTLVEIYDALKSN